MKRACAVVTILLMACASERNDDPQTPIPAISGESAGIKDSMVASRAPTDSIRLSLQLPLATRTGSAVPLKIRLENVSDRRLRLLLGGRPETPNFYFLVAEPDGSQVWNSLFGVITFSSLSFHTLEAGEAMEFTATWDQRGNDGERVAPGTYRAQGIIRTSSRYGGELKTEIRPLVITP